MRFAKKLSLVAVFATLSLFGCKQGEGETCQIDSDCEEGLTCDTEQDGRFCRGPTPPVDAAPVIDADPNADAAPPDAAPVPDAAAAAPDASTPDAGTPDGAAP